MDNVDYSNICYLNNEKQLGIDGKISKCLKKYPYTVTYDCEINFAPITIFKIKELKKFK